MRIVLWTELCPPDPNPFMHSPSRENSLLHTVCHKKRGGHNYLWVSGTLVLDGTFYIEASVDFKEFNGILVATQGTDGSIPHGIQENQISQHYVDTIAEHKHFLN